MLAGCAHGACVRTAGGPVEVRMPLSLVDLYVIVPAAAPAQSLSPHGTRLAMLWWPDARTASRRR
eukprot:7468870-Lingulodinium_polyedra.AAC.1